MIGLKYFAAALLVACGEAPPPPAMGSTTSTHWGVEEGPCESGRIRACSVTHEQKNGVIACWKGEQSCEEGSWSACLESRGREAAFVSYSRELASVAATSCSFNPCDPGCMVFDDPDTTLAPEELSFDDGFEFEDLPPWKHEPCQSGADCQLNHRCEDVNTEASCGHSKCQQGEALDAPCDPCVTMVCEAMPECCVSDGDAATPDWSAACVEQVQLSCDASCGDPTVISCSEPAPVVAWGSGENRCDYALMGSGSLAIYGAHLLGGDVGGGTGANALVELHGLRPRVSHNIYSQGSLDLYRADVGGDVLATGALDPGRCVDRVDGTCAAGVPVPSPSLPTRDFGCAGNDESRGGSGVLEAGSYGALSIEAGSSLELQAGTYRLARLTLGDGARLTLPSEGRVEIEVCGDVLIGRDGGIGGSGAPEAALRMVLYSNGSLVLGSRARVEGLLSAPRGHAYLDQGDWDAPTQVTGLLHVGNATLMPNSVVNATGLTGAACATALEPCESAVSEPPPGLGECVAQEQGDTDWACADFDLALGVPCGEKIPVCNHGLTTAPAGVELAFYEPESDQFALPFPDPAFLRGSCTLSDTIPAGECVVQYCDAELGGGDALVMINPHGASAPDECSLLDNWSLLDADRACGGGIVMSERRIYEAHCPEDRVASWGLLTWEADTPGTSSVSWTARVAGSEGQLAASDWFTLGESTSLGEDTQICSGLSGQSTCPVDVSAGLLPSEQEAAFLELGITLSADGQDTPVVRDFRITYSCVEDQ